MVEYLFMVLLMLMAIFLIVLVLIQRGKGADWPARSAAWAARARSAPRPATCSPASP